MGSHRSRHAVIVSALFLVLLISGCALDPIRKRGSNFIPKKELRANKLVNKALNEFSRSRYSSAVIHYSQALSLVPDSFPIRHSYAIALLRLGAFEQAEDELRKLLLNDKKSVELNFELANALAAQRKYTQSAAFFEVSHDLRSKEVKEFEETTQIEQLRQQKNKLSPSQVLDLTKDKEVVLKSQDIPLDIISLALGDVLNKSGDVQGFRCALSDAYNTRLLPNSPNPESLVKVTQVLTGIGATDEVLAKITADIPDVITERNMELLHQKSLIAIDKFNLDNFKKFGLSAFDAFDRSEVVVEDRNLVLNILLEKNPSLESSFQVNGAGRLAEYLLKRVSYWPPVLQEIFSNLRSTFYMEGDDYKYILSSPEVFKLAAIVKEGEVVEEEE